MDSEQERRFQRAPCSFPVRFFFGDTSSTAEAKSLSMGGGYFASKHRPPPGTEISFIIELSEKQRVRGKGMVVWNSDINNAVLKGGRKAPLGFAVEFKSLGKHDRHLIDSFVKRRLRIVRSIAYELNQADRDTRKIKGLFSEIHPDQSLHLNHIRKVVREELRYFRIRK
jgi:hypothetical protein